MSEVVDAWSQRVRCVLVCLGEACGFKEGCMGWRRAAWARSSFYQKTVTAEVQTFKRSSSYVASGPEESGAASQRVCVIDAPPSRSSHTCRTRSEISCGHGDTCC